MGGKRVKPKKLVLSAFGPYADKLEIDFEKLGGKGLYLITGDTGAGKTTIFYAITFDLNQNILIGSDFKATKFFFIKIELDKILKNEIINSNYL